MLGAGPHAAILDAGCGNGNRTMTLAQQVAASNIVGVEIVDTLAAAAETRGMTIVRSDLNEPLSFPQHAFDVVTALEVIEHLHRPETFVKEVYRVLKPGGYAIIATENLASWHNLFALFFGWQPFTLSQFSEVKTSIGNPLGLDKGETSNPALTHPSFRHCLVLAYAGLKDLLATHGFQVEFIRGAGYYPLPPWLASPLSALDPRHSAFLTVKATKPGTQ